MKFLLPVAGASWCAPPGQLAGSQACHLFQLSESNNQRKYNSTGERDAAYGFFLENLQEIEEIKKKFPGVTFSMNGPFFDWSLKTWRARNNLKWKDYKRDPSRIIKQDQLKTSHDEENFSWVEKGAVNAVKNQGNCGSCWAFSTVANIEGVHAHLSGTLYSLSESELVDCMHVDHGCNGGLPAYTDDELFNRKMGLELESAYPYIAADEQCEYKKESSVVFVQDYGILDQNREDQMQGALVQYGPLSVGVNADPLMQYENGIIDPENEYDCDPAGIDHAVTVTGYGQNEEGKRYWEVRNSWGPEWGLQGYFHLVRDKNACGVATIVSTVIKTREASSEERAFIA